MKDRGFTLPELLAALGISAVLLAMAAPGFGSQRGEAALRTAASRTLAALQLARRTALARGQSVTVCPTTDAGTCTFGAEQWMLFANAPGGTDNRLDAADEVLQRWSMPAGVAVSGTRGYAAFQPRPGAATTLTFDFCHRSARHGTSIVVSQTGRPRVVHDTTAHGCPEP
jgi:type IV fimbrial biogenesis protein FimT